MKSYRSPIILAVIGITCLLALAGCGSNQKLAYVPKCDPHAAHCREVSDNGAYVWIPLYYYLYLSQIQNTYSPTYQSSIPASAAPSGSAAEEEEPAKDELEPGQTSEEDSVESSSGDESSPGSADESSEEPVDPDPVEEPDPEDP